MLRSILVLSYLLLFSGLVFGQEKKVIGHQELVDWKSIKDTQISSDGQFVSYVLEAEVGDPILKLYQVQGGQTISFDRADEPRFTADATHLVFTIHPAQDSVKAMRRRDVKKDKLPPDTLAIYELGTASLEKIPNLDKVLVPEKWGGWLAYQQKPDKADTTLTKKENKKNGVKAVLYPLDGGSPTSIPYVTDITFAKEKPVFAFTTSGEPEGRAAGVYLFEGTRQAISPMYEGEAEVSQLNLDEQGEQIAFVADVDTSAETFTLFYGDLQQGEAVPIASDETDFLPEFWEISEHYAPRFSKSGNRLYFGTAPPLPKQDTTLLEEEIVQVEVWTYLDQRLYPQQKVQKGRDEKIAYVAVYDPATKKIRQVGNGRQSNVNWPEWNDSPYLLIQDESPYQIRTSWEGYPPARDVYLYNQETDQKELIASELRGYPRFSPAAKYLYWYNAVDTAWFIHDIAAEETRQLTTNEKVSFYDELDDHPDYPRSYGAAGWTTDDDFFIVYDRYDAWMFDPSGKLAPNNLTKGRAGKQRYRYVHYEREERAIEEVDPMLFRRFDEVTKDEAYVWFELHTGLKEEVQAGPHGLQSTPLKAENANAWVFTKEDFQTFPDLQYSAHPRIKESKKISDANPQQSEYNWGTQELFEWTSLDGQRLQGLLVKPENFDPSRQYPMIVNFYERSSDRLNSYPRPYPGRSTINYAYYASHGYVIFNPDVPYKIGYPGESAFNSVTPGVTAVLAEGFVDPERVGVQGHSWGGYQIAYLITRTNMFRCAESGAPVVNMISAYGGIRWGTGISRMFQYEHTQSRIGGTLWEKPLRYIENSPIFTLDKVQTPVLILHNDEDGAVPWYQGIEFFVAMRRLGKPAWMLNYNGEPHWPVKLQNRRDFQLRMSQFFDHYLKDAPMPAWMVEGLPAIQKGIDQNLELLEPQTMDEKH